VNPVRVTFEGLGVPQSYELPAAAGLSLMWHLERALKRRTGRVRRAEPAAPAACPDCKGAGIVYADPVGRGDFVAEPCARCASAAR
jgi:hypothetical protein